MSWFVVLAAALALAVVGACTAPPPADNNWCADTTARRTSVGAPPHVWAERTIYQVLTDRFATSTNTTAPCDDLGEYCGGTFDGITSHLDYIADMGFDAIWISPVVTNTPGGYHGYWALDLYTINAHFGSAAALQRLVDAAHARDMLVMLDVVANHVGYANGTDFAPFVPFNASHFFHRTCQIDDWSNQTQVEVCRLANLPDLNQTRADVCSALTDWVAAITAQFGFDGVRIDTVPEVPAWFWARFQAAVGAYGVGEVENGNVTYVAGYQRVLDGVLAYPRFFTLRNVFQSAGTSMYELQSANEAAAAAYTNQSLLGTFIDNHDNPRFLANGDPTQYANALAYTLLAVGIPIVYYGTEQGYAGGAPPACREPLWPSAFSTGASPMYSVVQQLVAVRKASAVWRYPQIQRYAADSFYAFTRGEMFVATTNVGSGGTGGTYTITYHPYTDGTTLCNVFVPPSGLGSGGATHCVQVANGQFDVTIADTPLVLLPNTTRSK